MLSQYHQSNFRFTCCEGILAIKKALSEKAISIDDLKSSLEWAKSNTPNMKESIATLERRIKEMGK